MEKLTQAQVDIAINEYCKTLSGEDAFMFRQMFAAKQYDMIRGHFPTFFGDDPKAHEFEIVGPDGLTAAECEGKSDEQIKAETDPQTATGALLDAETVADRVARHRRELFKKS